MGIRRPPTRIPDVVIGEDDRKYQAHSVIIATGATANWMGLENEQRLARSGGGGSACTSSASIPRRG